MRVRVEFNFRDTEIVAQAIVTNSGLVTRMDLYYPDLDDSKRPRGEFLRDIKEEAEMMLLEEANTPGCY